MEERILELLQEKERSIHELQALLALNNSEGFTVLLKALNHLEDEGKVVRNEKNEYLLIENSNYIVGVLHINKRGFGFVIIDEESEDIFISSRDLKDEEAAKVKATVLAYDGVAVITNTSNPVKELTIEQIRDIFTGKITNWSEVGGSNAPIVVVSREAGSGTRTAFEEGVEYSEEELVKDAIISKGNGDVKTTVSTNENAIGFVSFEYVDDAISSINVNGIEPTAANVKAGSYALSRPFLAVTNEQYITEDSQKLIDYITSEEGQQIVEDNKLITID